MPSKAYKNFKKSIVQVDRLLKAFTDMRPPTRGRKHLDHFTRAALLFLCSSWEVYIEQIVLETGFLITSRVERPNELPLIVQKTLSKIIKNSKHELEPIVVACDWRTYYYNQINKCIERLNTPQKGLVIEMLNKYLGISGEELLREIPSLSKINEIVRTRGEIAHNVFIEEYLKDELVKKYYSSIRTLTIEIEICLWNYVPGITNGKRPWQNTYKK